MPTKIMEKKKNLGNAVTEFGHQKNPEERLVLEIPLGSKVKSTRVNKFEVIINFTNKMGNEEIFVFSRDSGLVLNRYRIKERRNDFKD